MGPISLHSFALMKHVNDYIKQAGFDLRGSIIGASATNDYMKGVSGEKLDVGEKEILVKRVLNSTQASILYRFTVLISQKKIYYGSFSNGRK